MAVSKQSWQLVREAFGSEPLVSQKLAGELNIYVERYICEPLTAAVAALPNVTLVTQFGGAKVGEGSKESALTEFFPSISAAVPADCPTEWEFTGFADFAVFYFQADSKPPFCQLIHELCRGSKQPIPTTSPLIAAASQQISEELLQHTSSDEFVERLMMIVLEQTWRSLNGDTATAIKPGYIHLGRIQKTLDFIQNNLEKPLSIEQLALQVNLSPTHFRRLFTEATGMSTHQFIIHLRLKRARELLISTEMPLIHIATALGFTSQSHFTATFKKQHAVTPARYRKLFLSGK